MNALQNKKQISDNKSHTTTTAQSKISDDTSVLVDDNRLQAKKTSQLQEIADNYSSRKKKPLQKKENKSGLSNNKSGINESDKSNRFSSKVRQFWGERWYEHLGDGTASDGSHLKGRSLGLPSITGWLELKAPDPEHGLKVYISLDNFKNWSDPDKVGRIVDPTGIYSAIEARIEPLVSQGRALLDSEAGARLRSGYQTISENITRENAEHLRARTVEFEQVLGNYLKKSWTPVKLVLGILGLGVLAGGGMLLALISLPAWAVMAVEGLSFLYGTYLLYRWAKSDLLPTNIKSMLLLLNGLAMGSLVASTLYDVVGYYTGLLAVAPFGSIHLAAIPFGLLLEYGIVKFIEKLKALHNAANERGDLEAQ
jgi:hypothetical protein